MGLGEVLVSRVFANNPTLTKPCGLFILIGLKIFLFFTIIVFLYYFALLAVSIESILRIYVPTIFTDYSLINGTVFFATVLVAALNFNLTFQVIVLCALKLSLWR